MEEHFGIEIADDDIDASALVSLQALSDFVQHKLDD